MTGTVLWEPPADVRATSRIGRYMSWLGRPDDDYATLWQWSVDDLPGFWQSVWDYFDVQAEQQPTAVLADEGMPGAKWFPGATLNYAEHVLRAPGLSEDEPVV